VVFKLGPANQSGGEGSRRRAMSRCVAGSDRPMLAGGWALSSVRSLRREINELRRANEILKTATVLSSSIRNAFAILCAAWRGTTCALNNLNEEQIMTRLRSVVLIVCGVFAVWGAALVPTSAALPGLLNSKREVPTSAVQFSAKEAATTVFTILGGFGVTKCTEVELEVSPEPNFILGLFHIHFGGTCTTSLGGTCLGLGDSAGILVLGSFHIVYDTLSALGAAILFLLQHVHYECTVAGLEKLILVLGQVLCLLGTINALTTSNEVRCLGANGDPKEVRYWNDAGTEINIAEGLLASENEGVTYKMSAQEGSVKLTTSESIEIMA